MHKKHDSERDLFRSIDTWEEALRLLADGSYTRTELAKALGITPRQASRYIQHMIDTGKPLERDETKAWRLRLGR